MKIKYYNSYHDFWKFNLFNCSVMPNSFATPWTVAPQAALSMGFPRQEYWNGLLFPPPEDLPNSGIKPTFPALAEDSLLLSHQEKFNY